MTPDLIPHAGEMDTPHPLDNAGYDVHQLEDAVSAIERRAQDQSGRDGLEAEGERLIQVQRRLYALMWTLSLVVKNAA